MPATRILVLLSALLAGCPEKTPEEKPPELPSELEDAAALTSDQRQALEVPEALLEVLPYGPRTPVGSLELPDDDGELEQRGVVFSVSTDVAALTVHGLRRSLATAPTKPRVYVFGKSPTDGRSLVGVMTIRPNDSELVFAADPPHEVLLLDDLDEFLGRWRTSTGIALTAIGPRSVDLDIDELPADPSPFLDDLVSLAGHLYETDDDARRAFRDSLERRRSVHLGD